VAGEGQGADDGVPGGLVNAAMDRAREVADAVLYEGYLLYPYRASAPKNRVRWQWGVLMPPAFAEGDVGEHAWCRTELLAEPAKGATLHVRVRFLQLQRRIVEAGPDLRPVPSVTVGDVEYTTWDEAVEREVDALLPVAEALAGEVTVPFETPGGEDRTAFEGGRVVRRREPLSGEISILAVALPGPFGGVRLTLRLDNRSEAVAATRERALRHALIAAHTVMSLSGGHFLSATDPPEWASRVTEECRYERCWPVLVGGDSTVLCTPIILPDQPEIAEESAGNLFDGTEIDEILTLRTMTLTDEEKREARATDARAAELIDRVDALPPELLERLHGTVRYVRSVTGERPPVPAPSAPWWDPGADSAMSPETDTVTVSGVPVGKGSRVRLRPAKRADAHDMFLAGRTAVVQAVLLDVDDQWHLAVTVEDDLGADLYAAHGRYRYFGVDEVEPL
jgi:hypothetical protein